MFDANDFLTSYNESVLDDKVLLLPEGEYNVQIGMGDEDMKINKGEKQQDDGSVRPWAQLSLRLEVLDPSGEIEKKIFRKPMITYSFFLDLTSNGKPDYSKQKNVRLGALLTATNNNRPGWTPAGLRGKVFKVRVAHVKGMGDGKRAEVVSVGVA